ncbi:aldolase [Lachnospiraceae bacterium]|jgi:hypothetical protein|nr:aldolase/citrate lyase family protein [uncultured Schaedlerella sp.]EOS39933.1 hypothetical protein C808_00904 [Lachnospiraceae bacterium M18-1]MCI9152224.1 aldolase [Ruminococcus sp.]NBI57910.1 aldolase [Lachnospiraceae bacterium]
MALRLMYITNEPEIAQIAEAAGVERIFIDMEYIGKDLRQAGMDTVQSHHTVEDVQKMRQTITKSELMVRVNPIHEASDVYESSKEEIDAVIKAGADVVMLPYFKTKEEVQNFIELVDGRAVTLLLLETPEAVENIDQIIDLPGLDEIFIGLNDLSLGYKKKFMFEILADGTVERLCMKFKQKGIPYGFGGIASLDGGKLPGKYVVKEHYRLGSTCVILSRSFCPLDQIHSLEEFSYVFINRVQELRKLETECEEYRRYFVENERAVVDKVRFICEGL